MKNFIISLLSVIIGTAFLSIAIVNDKFKKNIMVVISLIIVITVLQGLPSLNLDTFSKNLSDRDDWENISTSTEISVEKLVNDSIVKYIRDFFSIDEVYVESDVFIYDEYMEISSVNVSVSADVELFEIWKFLRDNLKISGDISVKRIKNEGIK